MKRRYIAVVSILAVLLSSCASLPQRGAVVTVTDDQTLTTGVSLNAKGPALNATADEIVQGFLQAAAVGVSDDFEVARQFLTRETAARWVPSGAVSIYPDAAGVQYSQTPTGAVKVTAEAQGSVDKAGRYSAASSGTSINREFSLIRNEDGQWRIAELDDSILMSQTIFSSLYVKAPLYFLASSQEAFVPDQRWYPHAKALSMMADALLSGSSGWLSQAAHSVYTAQDPQEEVSVSLEGFTAIVDLPSDVMRLEEASICRLAQQFTKTFTSSGIVHDVQLSAQGALLEPRCAAPIQDYPYPLSDMIALEGTSFVNIRAGEENVLAELAEADVDKFAFLGVDYSSPTESIVGLSRERSALSRLSIASGEINVLADGGNLAAPSVDSFGWVWSVDNAHSDSLLAINIRTGEKVLMPAPDIAHGRALKVSVSREGARLVVVASEHETSQMIAYGIERSDDGDPISVGDPLWLGRNFTEIRDVAWLGDLDLAVIGVTEKDAIGGLFTLEVGGLTEQMAGASDAQAVTAGWGEESLAVLYADGDVQGYSGSAWEDIAHGVSAVAFPG